MTGPTNSADSADTTDYAGPVSSIGSTVPTLRLIKYPNTAAQIIRAYESGAPLAPAFFDKPAFYQALVPYASPRLEHALRYYGLLDSQKKLKLLSQHTHFILHNKDHGPMPIIEFQHRLNTMLEKECQRVEFLITPEELELLKPNFNRLIKLHGNQFLTGAPFFQGGVAHIDIFQWGNLYGVIKFLELDDEKSIKANVLIYFEDMADRTLEECLAEYQKEEQRLLKTVMPQAIITAPQILPQFTLKLQPR